MLGDKMYGNMLLGITGGDDAVNEAISYLDKLPNVLAQEVDRQ